MHMESLLTTPVRTYLSISEIMCVLPSVRSRSRSEALAQIYESLGSGWAIRTAS